MRKQPTYLHSMVIDQYAWNGTQFVRLSQEEFEKLEQDGSLIKDGVEVSLNYILVVSDDESFLTFDIGFGNVTSHVVEEAAKFCQQRKKATLDLIKKYLETQPGAVGQRRG